MACRLILILLFWLNFCGCLTDISAVKGDLSAIKGNMNKLIDANVQAQAGINNKLNEMKLTAGGDITQTNNDSDLLLGIFRIIIGALTTMIIAMIGFMKLQSNNFKKQLEAKDKWIENLIKSNNIKDSKTDEWMQKYIETANRKQ